MEKYNMFQGNELITNQAAKSLGYTDVEHSWFTEDIYHAAFFYLFQRFGPPSYIQDRGAGIWNFSVKEYTISIEFNSSWVFFIIYGNVDRGFAGRSHYWLHLRRQCKKNKELVIPSSYKWADLTDRQKEIIEAEYKKFSEKYSIDNAVEITQEVWDAEYSMKWFDWIEDYNRSFAKFSYEYFDEKYGREYKNAKTKHALRTLDQFIKNLLTPHWVRDVPYNFKGKLEDNSGHDLSRYEGNLKIVLESPTLKKDEEE